MKFLDEINSPRDLKKLDRKQLPILSQEIREEIIDVCSRGGLHLASSLGATDLIVALHYVLDSPKDRILFDVGHQAYAHKILTGRRHLMHTIKQKNGLSGFTKVGESEHDQTTVGHASTSVASALGMALARDSRGGKEKIVVIIGDGSLTGGMALAALNTIGDKALDVLIILNDNNMSISENVGGINKFMRNLQVNPFVRESEEVARKAVKAISVPLANTISRVKHSARSFFDPAVNNPFSAMGLRYVGPIDGHDSLELSYLLESLLKLEGPTLLHLVTKKGKGLSYAEEDPIAWHGPAKFDPATGQLVPNDSYSFSSAFGDAITELAYENPDLYAITPAMREGSGLVLYSKLHPERYIDVGIAEEVAVTAAAGMALAGLRPIVAIYSTFLQRAYDQIVHDVALENLNVIFAIDRAGIVGPDGATHNGVFDISFLRAIPNMQILQPSNSLELRAMLKKSLTMSGPIAIRYPKANTEKTDIWPEIEWGKWKYIKKGKNYIITGGNLLAKALEAIDGTDYGLINALFIKPLDYDMLKEIANVEKIICIEDGTVIGGLGSAVLEALNNMNASASLQIKGIPDQFIEHASVNSVYEDLGFDAKGIRSML